MQNGLVLLPPLIVLVIAIWTKKVIPSLLGGILSAALIATHFSPIDTILLIVKRFYNETDIPTLLSGTSSPDHLYVFLFLTTLGIIISLISFTGGINAYSQSIMKNMKNRRSAETTSLVLSLFFFMDDYLNSLTVGCIMQPLTDKFSIARAKLAFLIDTMSAPLCVLVPASSWVAFILSQMDSSGLTLHTTKKSYIVGDPFHTYLMSIPYMFYPIIVIISAWFIVRAGISFGPMHVHENIAEKDGNLFGGKEEIVTPMGCCDVSSGSMLDFFIPIAVFIGSVFIFMLYTGNWLYLGGTHTFIEALQNAQSFISLLIASLLSLSVSLIYYLASHKITLSGIKDVALSGFNLMKNSLLLLLCAWTFSSLLKNDLHTGVYLAHLLLGTLSVHIIPIMIFITSLLIAAATGTAWGTINVMVPLTIPLISGLSHLQLPVSVHAIPYLFPALGALISGAIAGCHISSISDSTVLASTSSGAYHFDHFKTQFLYVLPSIISTALAFILNSILIKYMGALPALLLSLIISVALCILILSGHHAYAHRKHTPLRHK